MKVWRVTLAFEPIVTMDIISNNVITVVSDVLQHLKAQGNKVDKNIIIQIELISVTEDMTVSELQKSGIIEQLNNEESSLI